MAPSTPAEVRDHLRHVVRPAVHPERVPLVVTARPLAGEPEPPARAVAGRFEPFAVGGRWGGMWSTTWFHLSGQIPASWAGREVAALIHLGGARTVGFSAEGLVYDRHLRPLQGLHHAHRECLLPAPAGPGPVELYVEAAANPIPRWHVQDWPLLAPDYDGPPLYALEQAELAVVDREAEALLLDAEVVVDLAERLEERRDEAMGALARALALVAGGGRDAGAAARAELRPVLDRTGAPVGPARHRVIAVGHAHIDTAWLWPVRETRRKCARSFANQVRLMDRFPEHRFACSQAVQYQWVKEDHPDLYRRICELVAEGRWEPVGGMWVEADSNLPSGESLVRQFVHGKRFFAAEFGVESHEMWIPDVFGYSAALPQIARQAGVTALVTQKMSWNDTNRFPHSTFWWEGHDGSRVLAHFPPADTYNGTFGVGDLVADRDNFRDGERSALTLYPFGYGDGGGGPTGRMLERARRMADAAGLPAVEVATVAEFLDRLRAEEPTLATWVGELYLEAHRATATTHADVKRANRRGEEALRAAEMWSVASGLDTRERLDRAWKLLLVNQFHDIIPGSSINWVYRDTAVEHAEVLAVADAVAAEAATRLAGGSPGEGQMVFNPSSYARSGVAELPDGEVVWLDVPACGWAPLPPGPGRTRPPGPVRIEAGAGGGRLGNGTLTVVWDGCGRLTSVWDHEHGREVLAPEESGNRFQLHRDHPKAFDAWDVDRDYLDDVEELDGPVRAEVVEDGPLRGAVRFERAFGSSRSIQVLRLSAGSRRIEFHTEVDWHEDHRFLKVAFPVAVRSARATYEIQHGHVERPTVENTSWDVARFEVSAHRWADLGEAGYGVALLNDCKYGYDIRGHTMRLSLLRAPGYPDPEADRGHHRFAYALLPHPGDLRSGRVVEEAEHFNLGLRFAGPGPARLGHLVSVDRPGVSVEAVKWADDGDGVVVRLCEVHGGRGPARVRLERAWSEVETVDLLERPTGAPAPVVAGGAVEVALRPFELMTLRFGGPDCRPGSRPLS